MERASDILIKNQYIRNQDQISKPISNQKFFFFQKSTDGFEQEWITLTPTLNN